MLNSRSETMRKLSIGCVVFILTAMREQSVVHSRATTTTTMAPVSVSRRPIVLEEPYSDIDTSQLNLAAYNDSIIWLVQHHNQHITIRFTDVKIVRPVLLYTHTCVGAYHIEVGPDPQMSLLYNNNDIVYHSTSNYVWIQLYTMNSTYWSGCEMNPSFTVQYMYKTTTSRPTTVAPDPWRTQRPTGPSMHNPFYDFWQKRNMTYGPTTRSSRNYNTEKPSTKSPTRLSMAELPRDVDCKVRCYVRRLQEFTCLQSIYLCNGYNDCKYGEDEYPYNVNCSHTGAYNQLVTTRAPSPVVTCGYGEVYCYVVQYQRTMCLHNLYKCNGYKDCAQGQDEDPIMCGDEICNKRLDSLTGWFASPGFPSLYPRNTHCSWVIHKLSTDKRQVIQLRVQAFHLEYESGTDYLSVYDGPDPTYPHIGTYTGDNTPPPIIQTTANWMHIIFKSDFSNEFTGFNFTFQYKGVCFGDQTHCVGEEDCYNDKDACNGVWDCHSMGSDEMGCDKCHKDEYSCGGQNHCYHVSDRCNGVARCGNTADENNCSAVQCGAHNGTFLCDNLRCIYESWTCDQRNDCGDNSDEKQCSGSSRRVIIAAISGSMICALLLVILLGCSCKLYSLRTADRHGPTRNESPMSRLYAELIRRRAPPSYHEAMLTSRNFDEVQQEYLESMRNPSRRSRRSSRRRSRTNPSNLPQNEATDGSNVLAASDTSTPGSDTQEEERRAVNIEGESIGEMVITQGADVRPSLALPDMAINRNNVNIDRQSSSTQLIPSDSDTDTDNSDIENLGCDVGVLMEHQDNNDDDNILASRCLSARWSRSNTVGADDSSDDVCILEDTCSQGSGDCMSCDHDLVSLEGQGHSDNVSVDTASASIDSVDMTDTRTVETVHNDTDDDDADSHSDSSDGDNNSRSSSPKPETCGFHSIPLISRRRLAGSQGSLDSIGSNTFSDNDVPMLALHNLS